MRERYRPLDWKRPETEFVTRTVGDTNSQQDDDSAQVDISYNVTPGPVSVARVETISAWGNLGGTNKQEAARLAGAPVESQLSAPARTAPIASTDPVFRSLTVCGDISLWKQVPF